MKGHERRAYALISEIVAEYGFEAETQIGGKHLAVVVTHRDGRWHKFPVSGSPRSSDCQLRQIRQQVMAWLESEGFQTGRGEAGGHRRRRRTVRQSRPTKPIAPHGDRPVRLARDPWEVLSALRIGAQS
ncbi:MAG: hypothetical protein V7672_00810 [Brevundimonas sp.]|uniref:hypothetical protein n=1 Tax=Brevundimonas sp. TaxID=1871086 RepID=UPI0030016C7A